MDSRCTANAVRRLAFLHCILAMSGAGILYTAISASAVEENKNKEVPKQSNGVEITIEGTRSQFSAGTPIGVSAQIVNKLDKTIYLNEKFTVLNVPSEIEGPFTYADSRWPAFFPTATTPPTGPALKSIALKPGDAVRAFWLVSPKLVGEEYEREQLFTEGLGSPPQTTMEKTNSIQRLPGRSQVKGYAGIGTAFKNILGEILTELNFVFFTPGDYKLTVSVNFWLHPLTALTDDYRIAVQTTTVRIVAPQSVILLGASIGGLIAYIILPQGRQRQTQNISHLGLFISKEILGILGAILLSAIVTILLSRISDTQFLIRVSISDFWGAITIGFISNYLGYELLKKLIGAEKNDVPISEPQPMKHATAEQSKAVPHPKPIASVAPQQQPDGRPIVNPDELSKPKTP